MSITSANAVITFTIPGVFDAPFVLQQFSADDIYDEEAIAITQAVMGVDGILTAGYTPNPTVQSINLQADSISAPLFDQWKAIMDQSKDVFYANAVTILPSLATKWTQTKGALTSYKGKPNAAKILQPRRMVITWESSIPTPINT